MSVGVEKINVYAGVASIDVKELFEYRKLDLERFDNLMMNKKSVMLPCQDAITDAVNAAKPIIDQLTEEEKNRIEMVITGSESAIDVGKALSTYIHDYLGLSRNCRLFEVKQCCYSGTASLQMAASFIAAQSSPGAKVLVLTSDSLPNLKNSYAEPSTGAGAVAMLISNKPEILELDFGANGYYSYEVMDFVRPTAKAMYGDIDLSLLSYLDCFENSYQAYEDKVEGADFQTTFDYLAFHTPFAGMVKGAHRKLLRMKNRNLNEEEVESDFEKRVKPSLSYCADVGNIAGGSLYLALVSTIDNAPINEMKRVGMFSYGSGCSSEFYSGMVTPQSKENLAKMKIAESLKSRLKLDIKDYDKLLDMYADWIDPVKDKEMDFTKFKDIYKKILEDKGHLVLKRVKNYHREYEWS